MKLPSGFPLYLFHSHCQSFWFCNCHLHIGGNPPRPFPVILCFLHLYSDCFRKTTPSYPHIHPRHLSVLSHLLFITVCLSKSSLLYFWTTLGIFLNFFLFGSVSMTLCVKAYNWHFSGNLDAARKGLVEKGDDSLAVTSSWRILVLISLMLLWLLMSWFAV